MFKAPKEIVTAEDFGFVSDDSHDEVTEKMDAISKMFKDNGNDSSDKTKSVSENKFVKSDIDYLSDLCAGLEDQIKKDEFEKG